MTLRICYLLLAVVSLIHSTMGQSASNVPAIIGGGSKGYIPEWLSSSKLGNSVITEATTGQIGIGTVTPVATLDVNGAINAATGFNLGGNAFAFGSRSNGNVFLGFAGNSTMTGNSNTAVGLLALSSNTTGYSNTAIGYQALHSNTAPWNTANGWAALFSNTTGFNNVATGSLALFLNTTGTDNLADGGWALYSNVGGNSNSASGWEALFSNTTGGGNVADGYQALYSNTSGMLNTAVGFQAGPDTNSTNLTNATAIGATATVSESNALVLGGTGAYAVKVGIGTTTPSNVFTIAQGAGAAIADGWSTYSSRRFKTNIQPLAGALQKITQMQGVSYERKSDGKQEIGVVAEDIDRVLPEVVSRDPKTNEIQGVDYARLSALLIEAVKAQQIEIDQLKAQVLQLASKP